MNKVKLKKILSAIIVATFITPMTMMNVKAIGGLTTYIGDIYGNNVVIEGTAIPNSPVTIKLVRKADNNIRYTNEVQSDKDGKYKFNVNIQGGSYKAMVSSSGTTRERYLNVNDLKKGIAYVRIEGKNKTLLKRYKIDVEQGHTTYLMAVTKALKDNNIPYEKKDNFITSIENQTSWAWKVQGKRGRISPNELLGENEEIVLASGELNNPRLTRMKISPMDKDIINADGVEITRGGSFIVRLEQLDVDMFGDSVFYPIKGQKINFNGVSKVTDENGEVVFTANNQGQFNLTCNPTMGEYHNDFIKPNPINIVVKQELNTGGSSGSVCGGSGGSVIKQPKEEEQAKKSGIIKTRISGSNRYETSKNIVEEYSKITRTNGVILALGENFPDALAGSVLCNKYKMPIILSGSTVKDSNVAIKYIENNITKDKQIYILGGTSGIGKQVEQYIKSKGYDKVERLGGQNRFETNASIVDKLNVKEGTPVVIASGENFPDALSISSIAATKEYPILLVNKDNISNVIKDELNKIKPSEVFVIGGTGSISDKNLNTIKKITNLNDNKIIRVWGIDRYDTSLAIAKYFDLKGDTVTFASGENFPDALSGSALSSIKNAPLILINNNDVSKQREYLNSKKYKNKVFYGGSFVIKDNTIEKLLK